MIAKTGGVKFQWEIMRSLGLEDEEIKKYVFSYIYLTIPTKSFKC